MKKYFCLILCSSMLSACVTSTPEFPEGTKRDIPLKLFTGFEDGENEAVHPHYDGRPITVTGPHQWEHPVLGDVMTAYKRERYSGRAGRQVVQYFVERPDGQGIGRAWDSRWPDADYTYEAKFPLGEWAQGEVRNIGGSTITVEDIFYGGDGIKYTWDAWGECWRYTYRMGVGLVNAKRNC
jgi:hypothetical protein